MLAGLADGVVGRRRESELVVAALAAGRHVLLEGPPGTGKSTLLRAVAVGLGIGFEFAEGTAELTPARLVGHFDPALVLSEGYVPEVFVDGPLLRAVRDGSLLYIEEINRVPEETLNALVSVMSEREVVVPRLGRVEAAPGFRLVAAMNPFDAIGTARIAGAVYDRVCRVAMGYQDAADERAIVERQVTGVPVGVVERAVGLVRDTRHHVDLRSGSSVRGAIDLCAVARELAAVRSAALESVDVTLDAALVALSGRVRVREGVSRTADEVITELWARWFGPPDGAPDGGEPGKATSPTGIRRAD
jgi:MoxR-like ATPase